MNRRGFLGSILALAAAPAIVRADSLMRVIPVETVVAPARILHEWVTDELIPGQHYRMREDLSDIIWDIEPMESPFISRATYKWTQGPVEVWGFR